MLLNDEQVCSLIADCDDVAVVSPDDTGGIRHCWRVSEPEFLISVRVCEGFEQRAFVIFNVRSLKSLDADLFVGDAAKS